MSGFAILMEVLPLITGVACLRDIEANGNTFIQIAKPDTPRAYQPNRAVEVSECAQHPEYCRAHPDADIREVAPTDSTEPDR